MTKKLEGKVALVTGGSRGMGAAIANRLVEDGADVAISYAASAEKAEANVREFEVKGVRAADTRARVQRIQRRSCAPSRHLLLAVGVMRPSALALTAIMGFLYWRPDF